MAKVLSMSRDGVSRLEKRSNLFLSTLRKSVEAMGGNLSLVAEFPDREPVVLSGIAEVEPSNIDGLTFQMAQSFLQGIRVQVEAGRLIVILSGERDFRDLVYGPNSEFNCSYQFVIQGYEQAEFNKYLLQCSRALSITFESPLTTSRQLWQFTGGSIHLVKSFLLWVVEKRVSRNARESGQIANQDVSSPEVQYAFSDLGDR